jgi:HEAT repeat protein
MNDHRQPQWSQGVNGDVDDFARLGASRDPLAFEPPIEALIHPDPVQRIRAAEAFGLVGDLRAVTGLTVSLEDKELASIRFQADTSLLRGPLNSCPIPVRNRAAWCPAQLVERSRVETSSSIYTVDLDPFRYQPRLDHSRRRARRMRFAGSTAPPW